MFTKIIASGKHGTKHLMYILYKIEDNIFFNSKGICSKYGVRGMCL